MQRRGRHNGRRDSSKEALRDAAAELFAEKGFAATSTREICQRAKVTKPALYYHFGNKEQLYATLVLDAFNEYQSELRRASLRGRSTREKLIEILTAMFKFARNRHNYWKIGFRMVFAPENESPDINYVAMSQAEEKLLAAVVREGIRKGELRGKTEQITSAISGQAITCIMGYLVASNPPLDRSTARGVIGLLLDGCGANATHR
jgi:AcrR family transcriptional regulator